MSTKNKIITAFALSYLFEFIMWFFMVWYSELFTIDILIDFLLSPLMYLVVFLCISTSMYMLLKQIKRVSSADCDSYETQKICRNYPLFFYKVQFVYASLGPAAIYFGKEYLSFSDLLLAQGIAYSILLGFSISFCFLTLKWLEGLAKDKMPPAGAKVFSLKNRILVFILFSLIGVLGVLAFFTYIYISKVDEIRIFDLLTKFGVMSIFSLITVTVTTVPFLFQLTKHISLIEAFTAKINSGLLHEQLHVEERDEFYVLSTHLNSMVSGMRLQIEALNKTEKKNLEIIKKLEIEQVRSKHLLEKSEIANVAKNEFLGIMSHELKTPMNGVLGMIECLKSTKLDDDQFEIVDIVHHSANNLLAVLNDILDFSKIKTNKMSIDKKVFEVRTLIENITKRFTFKIEEKQLEFVCTVSENVPLYVAGDSERLSQVLENLIGNAIKFTDKGSVSLHCNVENESSDSYLIKFSVDDTGIGVNKEIEPYIFDAFTQADSSTTRKYCGTGLGLSISKELSILMGGEIGMIPKEGNGTIFWFTVELFT